MSEIKDPRVAKTTEGVTTSNAIRSSKVNYSDKGIPSLLASGYFVQVHPEIIRKLESVTQALVLQQLSYWLERSDNQYQDENWVYNTYEDWAENLGITEHQVRRAINSLEEMGLIISCQPEAYNRVKWYRIDTEHKFWGQNTLVHKAKMPDGSGEIPASTSYTNTTQIEPNTSDFDQFWEIYPIHNGGKVQVKKVFAKALKEADLETILLGARRYRDDPNRTKAFTAYPATWLNQGRWADDPLPPQSLKTGARAVSMAPTLIPPRFSEADRPKPNPRPK